MNTKPGQNVGQSLGMIGLGRMGAGMARRLLRAGHSVFAYDLDPKNIAALKADGAQGADSLEKLVNLLPRPRAIWVMVPAGEATEKTVMTLSGLLESGDCVIDGGNSYFKDDIRRAAALAKKGIDYLDAGTSGGVWGLERGYCMMVGGSRERFARLEPIFAALAPGATAAPGSRQGDKPGAALSSEQRGDLHCGPAGSGHFVKMIHNGIEYGMMQALAEGFEIMKNADLPALPESQRFSLELGRIAELWRHGSVVSSWLLDLVALGMKDDAALSGYTGFVQDSGEGRWTIQAALEEAVPAHVLSAALFERFRSRQDSSFADKMLSAMRHGFGGHVEGGARPGGTSGPNQEKPVTGPKSALLSSDDQNLRRARPYRKTAATSAPPVEPTA